jgi:hypothetical protein
MRVLLDECVPRTLREQLVGHEVKTVAESGWAGAKNVAALLPLIPKVLEAIPKAPRGKVTNVN